MNIVRTSFHNHRIVILVVIVLMICGVYALKDINKNEFPDFTIRQGVVVAVYPGADASKVEQEVTKPLEDYIYSYKEVKKTKTVSSSSSGLSLVQVVLNDNVNDKEAFWAKFKHGMNDFKEDLPQGVLAVKVMDDFGDCSALLITMESEDKTYRQLSDYMDMLKDRLRPVEAVGRMTVTGMQKDQISVVLDNDRLSMYGLSDRTLAMTLFSKGFTTTAGRIKDGESERPVYVNRSETNVHDIEEMIVLSTPSGDVVRLKDVAYVRREYPSPESYITNNGHKCLLLSVEMKKGKNIVDMGDRVKSIIAEFEQEIPSDITLCNITDQSQVVGDSVTNFLRELMIAVLAVIIVVVLLLPIRTALVAASTIPITIFISLTFYYLLDFELNTVTLCVLILTLGMVVDNSIVIIDAYLEKIGEFPPDLSDEERKARRREATIWSARHYFKSIFSATLAISITFFPFLFTITGMTRDFLVSFPWAISIVLFVSLIIAECFVPYMQYVFIKNPLSGDEKTQNEEKKINAGHLKWRHHKPSLLNVLQKTYNRVIAWCFRHRVITLAFGLVSIVLGIFLMSRMPLRLMPAAERNQFAVEIYLPSGTSLPTTTLVADSLEHMMRKDPRVVSVASFKGCGSPRFQNTYAPQFGGAHFAQFIVNTTGSEATRQLLKSFQTQYAAYFPNAYVRLKQLSYSESNYPVEVRLSSQNLSHLKLATDSITALMRTLPELNLVRNDLGEPLPALHVVLKETASTRMGLNNLGVETTLMMRYGAGMRIASVWEGDDEIPVVVKSTNADSSTVVRLHEERLPIMGGIASVPLRQVASIENEWEDGHIPHRNGLRTVTIMADLNRQVDGNPIVEQAIIADLLEHKGIHFLPDDVKVGYGGEYEEFQDNMPNVLTALLTAVIINFFILLFHYRRISTAILLLACFTLCFVGTAVSVIVMNVDFGCTCVLGMVALIGILVRNSIIMIDFTEELCAEGQDMYHACLHSAQRRMRPIFLTSVAASMGVIPMILGGSSLWMPMGSVIFFGTLITMLFILTIVPVAYYTINKSTSGKQ